MSILAETATSLGDLSSYRHLLHDSETFCHRPFAIVSPWSGAYLQIVSAWSGAIYSINNRVRVEGFVFERDNNQSGAGSTINNRVRVKRFVFGRDNIQSKTQ